MNQENNPQETSLVLLDTIYRLKWGNEVERIWRSMEINRCRHRDNPQNIGCLGPSFYVDICGDDYCEEHAAWSMEGDAQHIEEELEAFLEGVRRLAARGLPLSPATSRVLSRLSLGSTAQFPIIHQELGAAE